MTRLQPLQCNANNEVPFKCQMDIHETFDRFLIRFCSRFLTTKEVAIHLEIDKMKNFLNV